MEEFYKLYDHPFSIEQDTKHIIDKKILSIRVLDDIFVIEFENVCLIFKKHVEKLKKIFYSTEYNIIRFDLESKNDGYLLVIVLNNYYVLLDDESMIYDTKFDYVHLYLYKKEI
jgi:hypothetical protein